MWDVLATENYFACIIVFLSSIVRISVFERSPVADDLILPSVCARKAYPRWFLGRVGRTPPIAHTHLATVPNAVTERGLKPFV